MMVLWRQAAYADVARIVQHIAEENPIAARQVVRKLLLAGDSLTMFPNRGRPGGVPGTWPIRPISSSTVWTAKGTWSSSASGMEPKKDDDV